MAWESKANLRGTAGYNATGAAEDDAAIAAFMRSPVGTTETSKAIDEKSATLVANPSSKLGSALIGTIAREGVSRFAPLTEDVELDIWDGFIYNGGDASSWDSSTYAKFIAGIDAKLGGKAVKETIGTASDGTTPIFAYTAGRATAPHVLLNCGMHPIEASALYAGMRFFTEFVTSENQYMIALRSKVRITYIPELNSANHRVAGRYNLNGVDINRNFPWNFAYNPAADKGAAALDQPETMAVKTVLDTKPIGLLIDCHDAGNDSPQMSYSATSSAVHAHREIFAKAAAKWQATNPDAPAPVYFTGATDTNATLRNWGGKYLRWDKSRINGASVLLEARGGIFADSPGDRLTRKGARWYASFIYKLITVWLEDGQSDPPLMTYHWWANRDDSGASKDVTLANGGRLIDTTAYTPVTFSYSVNGNNVNYLGYPIRHPGRYLIEWNANVELPDGSPRTRVNGRLGWKTMPLDGSNAPTTVPQSAGYVMLDQPGDFDSLSGRAMALFSTVPADSFQLVQLFFSIGAAGQKAYLRDGTAATLTVTPMPNFDPSRIPVVPRP